MKRLVPALLLVAFATACAATRPQTAPEAAPATAATPPAAASATAAPCNTGHMILNATVWIQASAEYRAASLQTYANARRALDQALADRTWAGATEDDAADQPPAVILDVDETVLDNTPFQARVIRLGKSFDKEMFTQWVNEAAAPAVPGAAEFLAYAHSRGVTPFYITNRDAPHEERGTVENLRRAGFPVRSDIDVVLLRGENGWKSDKSERRAHVAASHRVLLLVGDDLNDFANAREKSQAEREAIVGRHEAWWGSRWFMISNPMYGSWERALVGTGHPPCDELQRRIQALRTR